MPDPNPNRNDINAQQSEAPCVSAQELHFTVQEIGSLWKLSRRTIIRMFQDEPGVLVRGKGESRYKKKYITMRVPESVMNRVHQKNLRPQ